MSSNLDPAAIAPVIPPICVRRFSVSDYRRMGELGILSADDRVELLDGWISPKMNHLPIHDMTISLLENLIRPLLPAAWMLRIQSAISTADSEPEPDLAVVRSPATRYMRQHPQGADVALIMEVAESSIARDRYKCGVYARAGIPEYWLVNLRESQVEVYSDPDRDGATALYRTQTVYRAGDVVPFKIATDQAIALSLVEVLVPEQRASE